MGQVNDDFDTSEARDGHILGPEDKSGSQSEKTQKSNQKEIRKVWFRNCNGMRYRGWCTRYRWKVTHG